MCKIVRLESLADRDIYPSRAIIISPSYILLQYKKTTLIRVQQIRCNSFCTLRDVERQPSMCIEHALILQESLNRRKVSDSGFYKDGNANKSSAPSVKNSSSLSQVSESVDLQCHSSSENVVVVLKRDFPPPTTLFRSHARMMRYARQMIRDYCYLAAFTKCVR